MKIIRFIPAFAAMLAAVLSFPLPAVAVSDKEIAAPSAVLMDALSGEVLFGKNPHEIRACASVTKVMTLDLVMEALDSGRIKWTDQVTASEHAASMGGSDIWLEPGETMTVDEMVKATVVASANDAAVALAEFVCGSEDEFVARMNEKAKQLGMKETVFKNCNGLDEDGHVTSAYDVALMSRDLLRHRSILKYTGIWMDELRGGKTQLVNTNKLLKSYKGITGLKTGTTSRAGSCITATAKRGELELVAVVLGSPSGKQRFSDAAKLLDYGFANYSVYTPEVPQDAFTEIPVTGGIAGSLRTRAETDEKFLVKKGGEKDMTARVILPESISAPVSEGDKVGEIIFERKGERFASCPVTAAESVREMTFGDVFLSLLGRLVK